MLIKNAGVLAVPNGTTVDGFDDYAAATWAVFRVAPEVARGFQAGPDGLNVIGVGGRRP